MKHERPTSAPPQTDGRVAPTLQAILSSNDGSMDSVEVPIPLPDAIIRLRSADGAEVGDDASGSLHESAPIVEQWFGRVRSADSVVRYVEEPPEPAVGQETHGQRRRCARCRGLRSRYYVPRGTAEELIGAARAAYCVSCYPIVAIRPE
jgi:hypothetical protein